jgi:hypothetical protein
MGARRDDVGRLFVGEETDVVKPRWTRKPLKLKTFQVYIAYIETDRVVK